MTLATKLWTAISNVLSKLRSWKSKAASIWRPPASVQRSLSAEERVRKSAEAEQLLSNPLLREAFNSLEADILRQMYAVRLDDKEGHTRLVLALQTSRGVGRYLWHAVQDGSSAGQELQLRGKRID